MDFVMQNPDPLPGPSLPPPLRSGCPYLAARADSRPSPAMLSQSRSSPHYDPVHSSTVHWHHHLHPAPHLPPPAPPLPPYWSQQPPAASQSQSTGAPTPYPGSDHYSLPSQPPSGLRSGAAPYRYAPAAPLEPLSFSATNMSFRHSTGMPGRTSGPPPAQPAGPAQQGPGPSSMGGPSRGLRGPMLSPIVTDPFAPVPQQQPSSVVPAPSTAETGGIGSSGTSAAPNHRPLYGTVNSEPTAPAMRPSNSLNAFGVVNANHGASTALSSSPSSSRQAIVDRFPLLDNSRPRK